MPMIFKIEICNLRNENMLMIYKIEICNLRNGNMLMICKIEISTRNENIQIFISFRFVSQIIVSPYRLLESLESKEADDHEILPLTRKSRALISQQTLQSNILYVVQLVSNYW